MPTARTLATAPADWQGETAATLRLAAPLVLAQLTHVAISTTDVVMLGWLGPDDLAASALAVNLFFIFGFAGTGLVSAAAPLIAAALGARTRAVREVRRSFRSALHMTLAFVVPVWVLLLFSEDILLAMGQDPALSAAAASYLIVAQWALLPHLMIVVFRALLTALGRPAVTLAVTVAGLLVNAALNWMFIFGNWGAPALGLAGAALATLVTTVLMAAVLGAYVAAHPALRRRHLFGRIWRPDWDRFLAIGRIGTPVGLMMAFEISVFSAAVYLMGWIDTASVAAHAIALQLASIAFMVPLGLSQATVIRVGMAYGAGDPRWIGLAGWVSLAMALAFMSLSALLFWLFPRELAGLFLDSGDPGAPQVLDLAVGFLGIAALFQLFDGAQVVGSSMLRGLQDTRVPMLFALFGYWVAGLGGGYLLAFAGGLRGIGIWLGLAIGLGVVAVLMVARWSRREALGLVPKPAGGAGAEAIAAPA